MGGEGEEGEMEAENSISPGAPSRMPLKIKINFLVATVKII